MFKKRIKIRKHIFNLEKQSFNSKFLKIILSLLIYDFAIKI